MMKFGELLSSNLPIVTCFYADWNIQSSEIISILKQVSLIMNGRAKVLKLDVDKNRELARALQIGVLPTIIVYKNKREAIKCEGMIGLDDLVNKIYTTID